MLLDKQIIFDAFADVSEAAKNVKEQIGTESFDKIMKEEEDRIKTKEL